jgi:hypothetical protein
VGSGVQGLLDLRVAEGTVGLQPTQVRPDLRCDEDRSIKLNLADNLGRTANRRGSSDTAPQVLVDPKAHEGAREVAVVTD